MIKETVRKALRITLFVIVPLVFIACKQKNIIASFDPLSDFPDEDVVAMDFDMTNSVFEGLTLPNKDSVFHFTFTIDDKSQTQYYYKIYYQNISYAFRDDHPLSSENFYGSWENTSIEFKPVKNNVVTDSFCIVGNPRNEKKYFGEEFPAKTTLADIENGLQTIKNNKKWYASIVKKARENNVSEQEQMYKDLMWSIENEDNTQGNINRRERRNPRVGNYEFMLVVVSKDALQKLPSYIKDISKTKKTSGRQQTEEFVNPFDYFLNKEGKNMDGVYCYVSDKQLKTKVKYDLSKGVYLNRLTYPSSSFCTKENNANVCDDEHQYYYAQFEEYYHNINTQRDISQIQLIADVQNNEYTLQDYLKMKGNKNIAKKNIHPSITDICGKNIFCNNNTIELINPASRSVETARKENVGIKGRIGLTYGRYIYKIKFPSLLNKSGVWNGLTNAAWLIYQSSSAWNYRRESKSGYVQENYNENENKRIHQTYYSEIDIEMVKTSSQWPDVTSSKKNNHKKESDNHKKDCNNHKKKNFVFSTTNWDLACNDNQFIGKKIPFLKNSQSEDRLFCKHLTFDRLYQGKRFTYHRWTDTYRNLSSRVEVSNDIFSEPFYYYVIEWKPNEIVWYIGKDLDNLIVVGYMSSQFTNIPNNQMVPVITQEYHYSDYWLPVIFEQGLIPYSSQDLKGVLYELTVE